MMPLFRILNGAPHHELADVKFPIVVEGHVAPNGEIMVRCNRLVPCDRDDLFYILSPNWANVRELQMIRLFKILLCGLNWGYKSFIFILMIENK
jgi:hypothetical protein